MMGRNLAKYHHNTRGNIPENIIITQSFKTTSIIGIGRSDIHTAFRRNHDSRDYSARQQVLPPNLHCHDAQNNKLPMQFLPLIRNADNKVTNAAIFTSLASTL